MDRLGSRRRRLHVGGGVHEVHARSDQVLRLICEWYRIAILAHILVLLLCRRTAEVVPFVFSKKSVFFYERRPASTDDESREEEDRTDGNGARHVHSRVITTERRWCARSPSRVRVMDHGALTAPRLRVGTGRGVVRSRSLTGARASQRLASGAPMMLTHASTNRACAWVPQQPSRLRLGARRSSAMEGLRLASCGAYGCGGRRLRGLTVRSHSGPHGTATATAPSPSTTAPIRLIP